MLMITNDLQLKNISKTLLEEYGEELLIYNKSSKPLEIVGRILENNPVLLVLDDDMLSPDTVDIISNIKKLKKDLKIVFVTSNSSIELGKEISPLGISYYAIKPFDSEEFIELLNSLTKNSLKLNTN